MTINIEATLETKRQRQRNATQELIWVSVG